MLRRQTHQRCNQSLIRLADIAIVAPCFKDVLLRRIQSVRGNFDGFVNSISPQLKCAIATIVVALHLAHEQDGGAGALLSNRVHDTLTTGEFIRAETLTLNHHLLIFRGVLQGIVPPMGPDNFRMATGIYRLVDSHVLTSPNILNGWPGLPLRHSEDANLITHLFPAEIRGIITDGVVESIQVAISNPQLCLKSAVIGNRETPTFSKEKHRR